MLVITTPTGQIGRQVVDGLLDAEEPVRVIVRDPARLSPAVRERVEVVEGSHSDPDVVGKAFAGAHAVFWLVAPDPRAESVEGHYVDPTRAACRAIGTLGVKRVVGVSTMGRGIEKNAGHLSASVAKDRMIEDTGVSYRALQPPAFMENLLWQVEAIRNQGSFFWPQPADRVLPTVATRDIAAKAVELLRHDSWGGQGGVPVVSPDALSPDGMAQVVSEVLGRQVRYQQVGIEAYRATMLQHGASEAWAQGLADMAVAQNNGAYDEDHRTASPGPTGFRQWCEEVLKPAVLA
ncbi:NAD(P)H-binding protein [Streptomyces sp. NBC_00461]|uniref:NAD(P)H-binding protein n=1 Tax=unclassified Streptomyces TaxID=2593676 RepID=UPI00224E27EE|nr:MULTISPECIES: NAD(P)H-binding protein [unclassified Streptomyces]MCX5063980.1 NAD(P)H-binding protein [Streptomyces sp. NBC_00452]